MVWDFWMEILLLHFCWVCCVLETLWSIRGIHTLLHLLVTCSVDSIPVTSQSWPHFYPDIRLCHPRSPLKHRPQYLTHLTETKKNLHWFLIAFSKKTQSFSAMSYRILKMDPACLSYLPSFSVQPGSIHPSQLASFLSLLAFIRADQLGACRLSPQDILLCYMELKKNWIWMPLGGTNLWITPLSFTYYILCPFPQLHYWQLSHWDC